MSTLLSLNAAICSVVRFSPSFAVNACSLLHEALEARSRGLAHCLSAPRQTVCRWIVYRLPRLHVAPVFYCSVQSVCRKSQHEQCQCQPLLSHCHNDTNRHTIKPKGRGGRVSLSLPYLLASSWLCRTTSSLRLHARPQRASSLRLGVS